MGHFGDSGTQFWISNCRLELTQSGLPDAFGEPAVAFSCWVMGRPFSIVVTL